MPPENPSNDLIQSLRELTRQVREVDTRSYEEAEPEVIGADLLPTIAHILARAEQLVADVFGHYEARAQKEPSPEVTASEDMSFEHRLDQLMTTGTTAQRIADISFVARLELAHKRQQLDGLRLDGSHWEPIAVCASIRRRILKVASALERAMCEDENIEPQIDWYHIEMKISVEVRRVYAIFRRSLEPDSPPDRGHIHARIRRAGIAIAMLTGRDVYEELKIRDRQMLRELQHKVVSWLRVCNGEISKSHAGSGITLWQDAVGLANLLMQVNNRAELRDHDEQVLADLNETLFEGLVRSTRLTQAQLDQLQSLYGMDDRLDQCIELGEDCPIECWKQAISHVLEQRKSDAFMN
ncbi:MAG: hypothetical protein MJE77_09105 [Proteobacteria bacterium]|nr:hypothetical protein [Pseudomonadota bacterium]